MANSVRRPTYPTVILTDCNKAIVRANGIRGATGAAGKTVLSGAVDPTTEGVDGDFYINTATNKIFGPKATTWPAGVSLVGPAGVDGADGADGAATFLELTDTPSTFTAGKWLKVNTGGTALEWVDEPAGSYTLPTASDSVLGGVKVGTGLSITDGVLSATGGTAASVVEFSDPAHLWYGASGVLLASGANNTPRGDPCVVWDGTQWVMFYWDGFTSSPYTKCYYRTAPTLEGPWATATEITALQTYHKPYILVDEDGLPVVVSGAYHLYCSLYNGNIANKEIYHFTASSLTGTWTLESKVIAKGASGSKDEYNTDTPFALYKDGTVYLWYMGAPYSSLETYGLAERILRATASAPEGPFTKDYDDVLLPATSAAWDYGWMGGVQIRKRPNGKYLMVYNAGDTRPSTRGLEPNTSRIGYAYADSIDGPWTKDPANPYVTPTGVPSDNGQTIESTNIWRGYIAYDPALQRWFMFYNTGAGDATHTEKITYGREGYYDYFDAHAGAPYNIQAITTSIVAIANSRVNLTPGVYRVHYQFNVGHLAAATPKVDVDVALRLNGTAYRTNREFVGNFNYENFDTVLDYIVPMAATGYIDCTVQCVAGTPTTDTKIRRLRVNVQRIR